MVFCRYCGAELEMRGADCMMCGEPDVGITLTKTRAPRSEFEEHNPYLWPSTTPVEDIVIQGSPVLSTTIDMSYGPRHNKVELGSVPLINLSHYLNPQGCLAYLEDWNKWAYDCIWALKNGYPDYVFTWSQIAASVLKRLMRKGVISVDYVVRALGSGEMKLTGDEQEPLDIICRAMTGSGQFGNPQYVPSAITKKNLMPQTKTLSRDERIKLIIKGGIYGCDGSKLNGSKKTILVVDDVCTSGATLFGIREAILSVKKDATVIFLVAANNPGKILENTQRVCQEQNSLTARCFGSLMTSMYLPNMKVTPFDLSKKDCPVALKRLAEIKDAPKKVYCMGNLKLLDGLNHIAMVGSRMCTVIGKKVAKKTAKFLAQKGYCIVSGLADGIDSAAHLGTLDYADRTIAIVPSLTDLNDELLACEILKRGGLLLSENPPGTQTTGELLVARNRLQTGISLATFVIEAEDKKGGTMATALFSLNQGRPIFCPHGDEYSEDALELNGVSEKDVEIQRGGIVKLKSNAISFTTAKLNLLLESMVKLK
ncbi:DNA-processing protein DprA [Myxococcaceae bacterium GXIMD 01537]